MMNPDFQLVNEHKKRTKNQSSRMGGYVRWANKKK